MHEFAELVDIVDIIGQLGFQIFLCQNSHCHLCLKHDAFPLPEPK